ncbi:MAG: MFS transporter, partial [Raoultibacter sp.]
MAIISGFLASKTGKYKWMPIACCVIMAGGFFMLSQLTLGTPLIVTGISLFVLGFGIGLGQQILVLVVQNEFPSEIVGTATAANNFFRQIGSTLGASLVGTVFTSRLATELAKNVPASDHVDIDSITPEFVDRLSSTLQEGIKLSYSDALIPIFLYMIPLLLIGAVLMVFLKEHPLATSVDHKGEGGTVAVNDPALDSAG